MSGRFCDIAQATCRWLAGMLGRALEVVFAPIGFTWQICIALVPGMAAREVAVRAVPGADAGEQARDGGLRGIGKTYGTLDGANQVMKAARSGKFSAAQLVKLSFDIGLALDGPSDFTSASGGGGTVVNNKQSLINCACCVT